MQNYFNSILILLLSFTIVSAACNVYSLQNIKQSIESEQNTDSDGDDDFASQFNTKICFKDFYYHNPIRIELIAQFFITLLIFHFKETFVFHHFTSPPIKPPILKN